MVPTGDAKHRQNIFLKKGFCVCFSHSYLIKQYKHFTVIFKNINSVNQSKSRIVLSRGGYRIKERKKPYFSKKFSSILDFENIQDFEMKPILITSLLSQKCRQQNENLVKNVIKIYYNLITCTVLTSFMINSYFSEQCICHYKPLLYNVSDLQILFHGKMQCTN